MKRQVTVAGHVQFLYPRRWWQLWKFGWYRHENMGGKCWIRFAWPEYIDHTAAQTTAVQPTQPPAERGEGEK